MIRRMSPREQKILAFTVVALSFAFVYNGMILPLEDQEEFLDQKITSLQKTLTHNLKIIQTAEAMEAQYAAYKNQYGALVKDDKAVSTMLSELEQAAGKLGLHVTDLKPERIKHNEYTNQFTVGLTIHSEFVDIVRLLYVLQQPPYLFDVERAEFENFQRRGQSMVTTRLILGKAFIHSGEDVGEEKTR